MTGSALATVHRNLIIELAARAKAACVLKGEKPANLPAQAPTKYELVINLRPAKSCGV